MNLSRLLGAPSLGAAPFTVWRRAGAWSRGRLETSESPVYAVGVIQPAGADALEQLPEGDRESAAIAVYTATPGYAAGQDRPADEIEWRGARYRVASVRRWDACGYIQAVAVRSDTERSEE